MWKGLLGPLPRLRPGEFARRRLASRRYPTRPHKRFRGGVSEPLREEADSPNKVTEPLPDQDNNRQTPSPKLDPKDPGILSKILALYQVREVGEARNILLLFQYLVGAANNRRAIVAIKGGTGVGKNRLAKTVLAPFIKRGLVQEFGRITATYLEHLGLRQIKSKDEAEPDDPKRDVYEVTVREPVLYIQEAKGAEAALQSLKLFYSEGKIQLGITIKNRPVDLIVKGIQVVVTTTTSPVFEDFEFENRVSSVHIDESEEQTRSILKHQGRSAESFEEEEEDEASWLNSNPVQELAEFLDKLDPVRVSIPYGEELSDHLPEKPSWIRREQPKLQRIIKNIATIHQHQRTIGRDRRMQRAGVYADPVDLQFSLEIGLASMRETLTATTENERKILEIVKGEAPVIAVRRGTLDEDPVRAWTRKGILKALGLALRKEAWLGKIIKGMVDAGYLDEDDREKPYKLTPTGLEPETFDIKLAKDREALATWAIKKGQEIVTPRPAGFYVDPFTVRKSATHDDSDSTSLEQSEGIGSLHQEGQNEMAPTLETQNELGKIGVADIRTLATKNVAGTSGMPPETGNATAGNTGFPRHATRRTEALYSDVSGPASGPIPFNCPVAGCKITFAKQEFIQNHLETYHNMHN